MGIISRTVGIFNKQRSEGKKSKNDIKKANFSKYSMFENKYRMITRIDNNTPKWLQQQWQISNPLILFPLWQSKTQSPLQSTSDFQWQELTRGGCVPYPRGNIYVQPETAARLNQE
jgi:hypothetical protein